MRKQLLLIILLLVISVEGFAQGNWKQISDGNIIGTAINSDYTWLLYINKIFKINNRTNQLIEIDYPYYIPNIKFSISNNDELWVFSSKINHFKNGIWSEIPNSTFNEYDIGVLNYTTGNIISQGFISNSFTALISNKIKNIPLPTRLKLNSNFTLTNNNRIFFNSTDSDTIYEIDTNGSFINKFDKNRIGATSNHIYSIQLDNDEYLYVWYSGDGIYKAKLGNSDTTFQKIISQTKLDSLDIRGFRIDRNNNIVIERHGWFDDTLLTIFNSSGKEILNYNTISNTYNFQYYLIGFNHLNNPILILNNDLWKRDFFDWNIMLKSTNKYNGEVLTHSIVAPNNNVYFFGDQCRYSFKSNTIENLEIDTSYHYNPSVVKSVKIDPSGNLYILYNYFGNLELAKMPENSKIKFESFLPNQLNNAHQLDGTEMLFNKAGKLCILMKNYILIYNSANNWDTLSTKFTDNITELYSFCLDGNGDIWVGTNKGVAKVLNNQIEIQSKINATYNVNSIKYIASSNSLFFSNNLNSNYGSICTFNLNTESLVSTHTYYSIYKIEPMNNSNKAYIYYNWERIWRYDIATSKWDTAFNNHIANTPFNSTNPQALLVDKNDRVYLSAYNNFSNGDHSIYIYHENGFSSINATKNNLPNINLYPNPTSGLLTIDSKENLQSYSVYNLLGELIENGKLDNGKIDISELPSGVYTVKVVGERGESFRKVIKN